MPKQIGGMTLYTLDELAERMGLAVASLRKYIQQGRLRARKWGREWYVSEEEVVDYFRRAENPRSLHELKRRIEGASDETIERIWEVLDEHGD